MAKVVSPLEGGERKNHKYIKREWKNGKWQYWYKDPAKNATDVSQLKNQNGVSSNNTTARKTSDWAKAWLENKNKKSSAVKSTSATSAAAKVSSGKAAASKLVNTNNQVYKAKTTTFPVLNNEEYKKKAEELDTEAKTKIEQNEQQYRDAYEKEKEDYREKLTNSLKSKYGSSVPEEEIVKINSQVEEYTKTLWKDVYEPQVKRINSAIEEANKRIQRALKKRYGNAVNDISHSALMHYGIPGQKWGERNGPPYPLGQKQKSSSEKNEEKKKFQLTNNQKQYLKIGARVLAAGLLAYGGRKIVTNHKLIGRLAKIGKKSIDYDKIISDLGPEIVKKDILGFGDDVVITEENATDFAKGINPSGSKTNCGSVSSAVLGNLLGGDYQALEDVPTHMRIANGRGYDPKKLIECYEGAQWSGKLTDFNNSRRKVSKMLENQLLSQGNGASGIFYCEGMIGNRPGHYFCYTIINNKVHVLEGQPISAQQTGIDFHTDFYEEVGKLFNLADGDLGVYFARLDNCPVKEDRINDLMTKKEK